MQYNTFLRQLNKLIEQTIRYTPPNARRDYMDNYDKYVDFPYVEDPEGYQTHRPIEQDGSGGGGPTPGIAPQMKKTIATEQGAEPTIDPTAAGSAAGEEAGAKAGADVESGLPADMPGGDVGGMGDVGGLDSNMGGMMGGMGEQEEKLTSSQIGRVYELKKIYARLSSVETYLSRATEESILDLRGYVAQSIDLFEVVISNYDQYKDKVDDIIVQFYEFLDVIYSTLKNYYKDMKDVHTIRS